MSASPREPVPNSVTSAELMTIAAARSLKNDDVCFVGIGAPSAACNLARALHAPDITLIYESGTIGTCPEILPLSIGDGELCDNALTTVSVPEMFRYWLQGGHITVGFLGGAQIDRFANLNTTIIGDYHNPRVRLPGGGGAPEIAANCHHIFITMPMTRRGFVEKLPFITSFGFGNGGDHRESLGLKTRGPTQIITDLCVLAPDPTTKELCVTALHPGIDRDQVLSSCGWALRFHPTVSETPLPTDEEIRTLRDLQQRSDARHRAESGNKSKT